MLEEFSDKSECVPPDVSQYDSLEKILARNSGLFAVYLHRVKKLSYAKIATQLCLPVGTVKSLVSRGFKQFGNFVLEDLRHLDTLSQGERPKERWILTDLMLNALPEPYYTAMYLHHRKKLSYSMIAKLLQEPEGTIKSRCSRAARLIYKRFGEE